MDTSLVHRDWSIVYTNQAKMVVSNTEISCNAADFNEDISFYLAYQEEVNDFFIHFQTQTDSISLQLFDDISQFCPSGTPGKPAKICKSFLDLFIRAYQAHITVKKIDIRERLDEEELENSKAPQKRKELILWLSFKEEKCPIRIACTGEIVTMLSPS